MLFPWVLYFPLHSAEAQGHIGVGLHLLFSESSVLLVACSYFKGGVLDIYIYMCFLYRKTSLKKTL